MADFDLGKFLADAGVKVDTGKREQIEYIDIDKIVPDPENFYELSDIDALAENIALFGLRQPLRVREQPDGAYMIVSGHRRYTALKKIIAEDSREDLREVPCIVEAAGDNPALKQLALIYDNMDNRKISSADFARQVEQVEKLLYQLQQDGYDFPGRMRDHVSEICKASAGKIARVKYIKAHLIPELQSQWGLGSLRDSVAYAMAKISTARQNLIYRAQTKDGKSGFRLSEGWVESIVREMDKAEAVCKSTKCPHPTYSRKICVHDVTRRDQAAKLSQYSGLFCQGCCADCTSLTTCRYSCRLCDGEKREKKQVSKDAIAQAEEAQREREAPILAQVRDVYSRVAQIREERHIGAANFLAASKHKYCIVTTGDLAGLTRMERGDVGVSDLLPGGLSADNATRLIAVADLLGCSIDYLLGRTDVREMATAEAGSGGDDGTD